MTTLQFNNYYSEYYDALNNYAWRLTRDPIEAEELVQETAIKAFKALSSFKIGTSFKSWAFTILKNTFITKYNKRKKRSVVNAPIEDFTYALENENAVKNDAVSRMTVKEIEYCISTLSNKTRLPFIMHVEGYQYEEIAQSLEIPVGTVKSRINFARRKLKDKLKCLGNIEA